MAATNDARVDTTFIGYLLIGFTLLLLGVFGLMEGHVFGDDREVYQNMPLDTLVLSEIIGVIGLVLVLLAIFAYRTGKGSAAAVFLFYAMFSFAFGMDFGYAWSGDDVVVNSNWFIYIALTVFFIAFMAYALAEGAPKFVALLMLMCALVALFIGLSCYFGPCGPGASNSDASHATCIISGIFGFLGCIVATYLGLAYANPKRIPVI